MNAPTRTNAIRPTSAANLSLDLKHALGQAVVLFKLRVVVLLVLSSVGGALLASGGRLPLGHLILLLVTGTLSSAGASAINQYLERDQDSCMQRTRTRPLAAGGLARPQTILEVAVALVILAVMVALPFSAPLAFFLAAGAVIYVGVYTLWLKPRTLLNIVIGGAAGSCAVLSGGAAGGNWADPGVVALSLLVFAWTPTHFWSLAQAHRDDYARASFPMLPVVTGARTSAGWITLHTGVTALIALALSVHPSLGWPYLLPTSLATLWLGQHSVRLILNPDRQQALKLFRVSNAYLGLVLLTIFVRTLFS
jgi:protoheme IX farnesyltransferase